jgi:hypothetical protein
MVCLPIDVNNDSNCRVKGHVLAGASDVTSVVPALGHFASFNVQHRILLLETQ